MLEQEFEKLLGGFFEDDLAETELVQLREAIAGNPAYRRRFQREIRLHSLMREAALVRLEEEKRPSSLISKIGWRKLSAIAAVLIVCAFVAQMIFQSHEEENSIGHCVHVAENSEVLLVRQSGEERVRIETTLRAGDRIRTGDGQVSFDIDGVGLVTLKSHTELELFPADEGTSVLISRGKVLVEAEKREPGTPPAVFKTPKAEVKVMGTVFAVEVNRASTRVKVHEGLVRFSNRNSDRSVDVQAGQYSENREGEPVVFEQSDLAPGSLLPGQERVLPTDDIYSEGRRFVRDQFIKVEKGRRTTYLKFQVPDGDEVLGATLRLFQSVDAGGGGLKVMEGSHHDWNEGAINHKTAPTAVREIARRGGWIELDSVVELDVSSLVTRPGVYTLMLKLESGGSHDIWFGSKESSTPPELVVTRRVK